MHLVESAGLGDVADLRFFLHLPLQVHAGLTRMTLIDTWLKFVEQLDEERTDCRVVGIRRQLNRSLVCLAASQERVVRVWRKTASRSYLCLTA